MYFEQETPRLFLRVLTPDSAPAVLEFYKRNASIFEKYEPIGGEAFYTTEHHKKVLEHEYQEILNLHMLRFWIFEKEHPDTIVGTVCFRNITPSSYASTLVGYKMDQRVWRKGYCYEALCCSIGLISREIGIHRFEALVLPENLPSIRLLEKLGFQREGILKNKVFLQGKWQDHYLYGLISQKV